MDFRIVYLPPFEAVSSGADKEFDFSPEGILGKFDAYFSAMAGRRWRSLFPSGSNSARA